MGRWLLGSVTDKVVRSSGNPVLVVRPAAQEDDSDADRRD
ncbi:MAG: universal stress protein [Ardenticatenaceae bacterium]